MIVLGIALIYLTVLLSLFGVLYTLAASFWVRRFFALAQKASLEPFASLGATILKPLHGAEPALQTNLESFFLQTDAEPVQIVMGVQSSDDPARRVAEGLIARYPTRSATLCINAAEYGSNGKISNLINMAAQVRQPVLVLSDSDIAVRADYLRRVKAALSSPNVGLVTCPYYGEAQAGFWSTVAAMGLSYQFLSDVIAGVALGLAHPCMGSTVALTRETLQRIGGFEAYKDTLADDYAMGAAVRKLGLRAVVAPVLVAHGSVEASLAEVFAHELRWSKTIRSVDRLGHAGSLLTHPAPLAALAVLLSGFSAPSLMLLGMALLARVWLMRTVDRGIGRPLGSWWLIPFRDMLSFSVFVASFFVRSVEWRGVKFHVSGDGDLKPV